MKKIKNALLFILSLTIIILTLCSTAFAHAGKTDEYGGHFDGETGEYHYHHGYPAHQHPNGICPYNYSDNANHSIGNSSNGGTTSEYTTVEHQSTTKHNIHPSNNNSANSYQSSTDKQSDNMSTIVLFSIISGIIFIVVIIRLSFYVRKKIRRKKSLYYLSVLKPQFEDIKNEELLLKTNCSYILNSSLQRIKKKKYEIDCSFYVKLFSLYTLEELCKPPEGIKIINNEIIDEKSNQKYGRYTVYKTISGKTIHSKKGCSGSYIPINILSLDYNDSKKKPCKICCSSKYNDLINSPPEWYLEFIKIQEIKNKYNIK